MTPSRTYAGNLSGTTDSKRADMMYGDDNAAAHLGPSA
jgi:hypothetical protein